MNAALERFPQLARVVLPAVAFGATVTTIVIYGLPTGLLFAAGSVLVWVISMFWTSVQSLTGETPLTLDEALSLGAPSAEEERKRAVLRALKDLEYERGVGKISEEDFVDLSARYRAEAKALLQILERDLGPAREQALRRLERRLKKERIVASEPPAEADASGASTNDDSDSASAAADGIREPKSAEKVTCPSCSTPNDADARFCKGCGAAIQASVSA